MENDPFVENEHVTFESAAQHACRRVPVFAPHVNAAEARQALEKLSNDPKLSSQQRDILTSTRQILDEMKAAVPK